MKSAMPYAVPLALGDAGVFLVFAILGTASHEGALTTALMVRTVFPLVLAWLAAGLVLGAFRLPTISHPGRVWRVLAAWVVAGPIGLLLRSWWFDRPLDSTFTVIALVGNAVLLAAWRLAFAVWLRRKGLEIS